jgi:hypothetical protein
MRRVIRVRVCIFVGLISLASVGGRSYCPMVTPKLERDSDV